MTQVYSPMRMAFELAKRDGVGCHICGLPCDLRTVTRKTAITATRDHIIPRSQKGTLALENLRLAHAYCNSKRGSLDVTDELRAKCKEVIQYRAGHQALLDAERFYKNRIEALIGSESYRRKIKML